MGDWRQQGQAQRRRSGAPSSHLEGTMPATPGGDDMGQALAGMAAVGSPRVPMSMDAVRAMVNASGQDTGKAGLVPRKGPVGGDLTGPGGSRPPVMQEKLGARYAVLVDVPPPISHEAGPTLANARIVVPAVNRTSPNFYAGSADADA